MTGPTLPPDGQAFGLEVMIYLNQVRQDVIPLDHGLAWFLSLGQVDRLRVLGWVGDMVEQTHPTPADHEDAVAESGLRPTFTPCVLLRLESRTPRERIASILALPPAEQAKSFTLLMTLWRVGNRSRQAREGHRGHHWWNWDLSRPDVLDQVRQRYRGGDLG